MKTMNAILGFGLTIGLMGCSSSYLKSDYDREARFGHFESFDWMSETETSSYNTPARIPLTDKRIKDAVVRQLDYMGYQLETAGDPDFLVAYSINAEKRSYDSYYTSGYSGFGYGRYGYRRFGHGLYGYGRFGHGLHGFGGYPYGGYGYPGYGYREYYAARLTVEFVDPESGQVVWSGWYDGTFDDGVLGKKKVDKAVRHILEEFPPEK